MNTQEAQDYVELGSMAIRERERESCRKEIEIPID
jgi:hypothetical protein